MQAPSSAQGKKKDTNQETRDNSMCTHSYFEKWSQGTGVGTWNSLTEKEENHPKGWNQSSLWAGAHGGPSEEPYLLCFRIVQLSNKR